MCSRYPLPNTECDSETDVHYVHGEEVAVKSVFSVHHVGDQVDIPLLDGERAAKLTRYDPELSKVVHMIRDGWSNKDSGEKLLKTYRDRRSELSVDNGCVLWGSRVIIPEKLRGDILDGHGVHEIASSMLHVVARSRR